MYYCSYFIYFHVCFIAFSVRFYKKREYDAEKSLDWSTTSSRRRHDGIAFAKLFSGVKFPNSDCPKSAPATISEVLILFVQNSVQKQNALCNVNSNWILFNKDVIESVLRCFAAALCFENLVIFNSDSLRFSQPNPGSKNAHSKGKRLFCSIEII